MAALPQNNTHRFFLDYQVGGDKHTLSVRYGGTFADYTAAMSMVSDILDELDSSMYLTTVLAARRQASGTDVSLPVAWSGSSSYGADAMPNERRPYETRWLGRSNDGRRTSFSLYGLKTALSAGFRLTTAASAEIAAVDAILAAAALAGTWVTISGNPPEPYPYVDINFNSYWEGEARN